MAYQVELSEEECELIYEALNTHMSVTRFERFLDRKPYSDLQLKILAHKVATNVTEQLIAEGVVSNG